MLYKAYLNSETEQREELKQKAKQKKGIKKPIKRKESIVSLSEDPVVK